MLQSLLLYVFIFGVFFIFLIILCIRNCYFAFKYPNLTFEERAAHKYHKISERKKDMAVILLGALFFYLWTVLVLTSFTIT